MSGTRQRILDAARGLFNEHGVHRVGVRDIARATGMSPGNLAYHFPTKDDLVSALVMELHEINQRSVFAELPTSFSMVTLYVTAVGVMRNILRYRFVLLSYVDAVRASPELQQLDASLRVKRRRRFDVMIHLLAEGGYIEGRVVAARADYLHEQGEMISSGWLAAAALQPGRFPDDDAIVLHYAKVGCVLLEPYCTPKGTAELSQILAGDLDKALLPATPAKRRRAAEGGGAAASRRRGAS